ncbi:transaldolase [Azospirillum cavernae]|uniref:Transaldolase n=1 Tax=Azospirillum cavernae TaxID=2320860 RepID=A0A418VL83_9PROT|nr:transaldolase [Azospirillum cavernae]RJF76874.1 transaldolase [Azospirillum cavernae]
MEQLQGMSVKIFADGAELSGIAKLAANPLIKGFTTNPTLMRKAGVSDYLSFARSALRLVPDRPFSFEVFADDFDEMERQAHVIARLGRNVNVKIPVTNTKGDFTGPLIRRLSADGVAVNVTALTTVEQVRRVAECLTPNVPALVSVFAGRVADTGRDPVPLMAEAVAVLRSKPGAELIWASPRELLNVVQADAIGCHIITITHDLLAKLPLIGKDLDEYSIETVQMFYRDATAAGYSIGAPEFVAS